MDGARTPNEQLAAVMAEAGMSNKGLAARVCAEADPIGLAVSYDHGSVRGWLKGVRPRAEAVPCIAAALSKKLSRPVTPSEIGFEDEEAESPDQPDIIGRGTEYQDEASQAVGILDRLTNADLAANSTALEAPWSVDAAPRVITGYLFSSPLWTPDNGEAIDGSQSVAERIRLTLRSITQLDFQFGGGHVRTMLLSYWKSEIVPELRRDYPANVRRELFAAAADAAEVLGWSAYDDGHHGTAQRYFIRNWSGSGHIDRSSGCGHPGATLSEGDEGIEEVEAMLRGGGEVAADGAELLGAGDGAQTARHLLPQLDHADLALCGVVVERHSRVGDEPQV